MSINSKRQHMVEELNQVSQRCGNLTILYTNALASQIGLSATEFECLSLVRDTPVSAGRLAELCGLTTGAITGLIDRLERAGFVERTDDPEDRRKVVVVLKENAEAHQRVVELYQPLSEGFNELADQYSLSDLSVVVEYLKKSNELFDRLANELHQKLK